MFIITIYQMTAWKQCDNVKRCILSDEPTKNYHLNLQRSSAFRSFIVSFIPLFSCPLRKFTVLVTEDCPCLTVKAFWGCDSWQFLSINFEWPFLNESNGQWGNIIAHSLSKSGVRCPAKNIHTNSLHLKEYWNTPSMKVSCGSPSVPGICWAELRSYQGFPYASLMNLCPLCQPLTPWNQPIASSWYTFSPNKNMHCKKLLPLPDEITLFLHSN